MTTTTLTEQDLYNQICDYIVKNTNGTTYNSWYVGITDDPERRLFDEHNVSKESGPWIYGKCFNDTSAREVEKALIDNLGTQGAPGGGDKNTVYVYAYVTKNYTNE